MKLNPKALLMLGKPVSTDLVIAAHQDDIEIMCPQGIVKGYQSEVYGLVAVVATDGAGSPRTGKFANMTDDEMKKVRIEEQRAAQRVGDYSDLIMLNYTSSEIRDAANLSPVEDMKEIILNYRPKTVYIHNLADKHPTHVGTALKALAALRALPKEARPEKLYGCEVWRGLDWISDSRKVIFDLTGYEQVLSDVLNVYESQIAGGKEYEKAAMGRRYANATFSESHGVDKAALTAYAMDLTPLIEDDTLSPREFILDYVKQLVDELYL